MSYKKSGESRLLPSLASLGETPLSIESKDEKSEAALLNPLLKSLITPVSKIAEAMLKGAPIKLENLIPKDFDTYSKEVKDVINESDEIGLVKRQIRKAYALLSPGDYVKARAGLISRVNSALLVELNNYVTSDAMKGFTESEKIRLGAKKVSDILTENYGLINTEYPWQVLSADIVKKINEKSETQIVTQNSKKKRGRPKKK